MKPFLSILLVLYCASAWAGFDWDPFHEEIQSDRGAHFEAWRPFYSSSVETERWRKDYLWPIYTRKGFKDETYSRLLFFGYSLDFSPETERDRTWILPFYFQGTDAAGENYFALFPLGGTIHEFLGRDRLSFVLFPLYAESSINDLHTTSILWPVGSKTSGEGVSRFRVWPFYGSSSLEGEYQKRFVLWPIYSSVRYTNERNPGGGFILMPIYGRVVSEQGRNQWFVPPLFRFSEGRGQRLIHAPYPFVQWSDGDVYKRYYWPIYGKKEVGTLRRQFWCWPVIWNSRVQLVDQEQHRFVIIPVFQSESILATGSKDDVEVGDVVERYWKAWPLMSWERHGKDTRFRMLELWPLRDTPGVERNWAPIWTLYRREKVDDTTGHHLLWGLYRQSRGEASVEWSLLKGLLGYKKNEESHSFRFLFMHFGEEESQP
ncbi:MAG: hypothetical protein JXR25_17120 [Pontiellaceae bacterium]|nr:hypothetical protein [Pontiellaceae bacterium]